MVTAPNDLAALGCDLAPRAFNALLVSSFDSGMTVR